MNIRKILIAGVWMLGLIPALQSLAQGEGALNFKEWKAQQVLEAEQDLARAKSSARGSSKPESRNNEETRFSAGRIHHREVSSSEVLNDAQRQLRGAQALSPSDYYLLYLRHQSTDEIRRHLEKLPRADLVEILASVKQSPSPDAGVAAEGLAATRSTN